jgi:hypothetical protein
MSLSKQNLQNLISGNSQSQYFINKTKISMNRSEIFLNRDNTLIIKIKTQSNNKFLMVEMKNLHNLPKSSVHSDTELMKK